MHMQRLATLVLFAAVTATAASAKSRVEAFGARAIEMAVAVYGADRIVCGTDGTAFGVDWTRKALEDAQIGDEARAQILHRNADALLARLSGAVRQKAAA